MDILDQYTALSPDLQNTIDIFKGEWSSKLPDRLGNLQAGGAALFEDGRISWAAEQMGGVQNKTVLELGPLEGGHTYMLEQLGAASITAVEANSRAFLKCLVAKEILAMQRSRFLYGDCIEFLKSDRSFYDVCIASGVLYHMRNPVEMIALTAQKCNQLFIWTHYYDAAIIENDSRFDGKFPVKEAAEYAGFKHTLHRQEYQTALGWSGFCGGSAHYSQWMSREDILACCRHFGFEDIRINFDHRDHPNGPCFAFVALKNGSTTTGSTTTGSTTTGSTTTGSTTTGSTTTEGQAAAIQAPNSTPAPQQSLQTDRMQQRISNLQKKVQHLEQQLKDSHSRIAAMETSKFWQLRGKWFQMKKTLGLPVNE